MKFSVDELRDVALFEGLKDMQLEWFCEQSDKIELSVDEHMFERGDPAEFMYVVTKGKIEGEGAYTYPDGRSYVGEFRNGMRNGYGILEFPSGEIYEGQWRDDKKNGRGILIWPDGEKYVGGFRDGKMDGKGTYTYLNGRAREGVWSDGELVRSGTAPAPR